MNHTVAPVVAAAATIAVVSVPGREVRFEQAARIVQHLDARAQRLHSGQITGRRTSSWY